MNFKPLLVAIAAIAAGSAFAQRIQWAGSLDAAMKQAKSSNKLVMAEFFAEWDPNGKRLEVETFADPAVIKQTDLFVPVRVNAEKEGKEAAEKYRVVYYPSIIFIDPQGNVAGIIDGYESSTEFVKHTDTFLKDFHDYPLVRDKGAAGSDLDAVARLGAIYADRYEIQPALAQLKKAEALDATNSQDKISDLYNAIGDYYQNRSEFSPAIKFFQKAGDSSKDTDKKAYGYLSIAACYFSLSEMGGGPAKMKLAIAPLQATLRLSNLKPDDRKLAQDMLEIAKKAAAMTDGGE